MWFFALQYNSGGLRGLRSRPESPLPRNAPEACPRCRAGGLAVTRQCTGNKPWWPGGTFAVLHIDVSVAMPVLAWPLLAITV